MSNTLHKATNTRKCLKLGDALLLHFCRHMERLFGKNYITPNMHLHCHLVDCILDYGPLHSFAFERFNGILGAMPNNNRSIEAQLMQRYLRENQATSLSITVDDELSKQLLPLFPKVKLTGSVAETMSVHEHDNMDSDVQLWTIEYLNCELPKFSSRCALDAIQRDRLMELYSCLYSVSEADIDVTHTCKSYTSLVLNGKLFGTYKSRTASSSVVFAPLDSNLFPQARLSPSACTSRPARINKFYKHSVFINGEHKVHLLAFVSWFKCHPMCDTYPGKPISLWFDDLYEYCSFIPVSLFGTRAITSLDKHNGEPVLFVVSCVE